jgi:hypothetical protein
MGFKPAFSALLILLGYALNALIRQRSKPNLHVGKFTALFGRWRWPVVRGSLTPCSRADEPLQAFGEVSPQVTANGQLDGAPSGSHVDTQFSITTTVC